jgi:hypothetical protein
MPSPNVNVAATPGGVHLSWSPLQDPAVAPAGPTYTVSRADLGLLTPQPLGYPGFTHKTLLSYLAPATYTYTVEAKYVQGCGTTSVTVQTPQPWAPGLSIRECVEPPRGANLNLAHCQSHTWSPGPTQLLTTTKRWIDLILEWYVPQHVAPFGGDNVGWMIHGYGLSANGVFVPHHCASGPCTPQIDPFPRGELKLGSRAFLESGDYVYTVAPVWDTPDGGRFYDRPTAARVVVRVE